MNVEEVQKKILEAAVRNMQEFGYTHVDEENIISGKVERMFFKRMLEQARSESENPNASSAIDNLLALCADADRRESEETPAQAAERISAYGRK